MSPLFAAYEVGRKDVLMSLLQMRNNRLKLLAKSLLLSSRRNFLIFYPMIKMTKVVNPWDEEKY